MVFQRLNPFPQSIYDNVAFGLRVLGRPKARSGGDRGIQLADAALWDEVKDRLDASALTLNPGQQQCELCIACTLAVRFWRSS